MEKPSKYAYFVVNDSDDLEELQNCLAPFGGVEAMKDVVIDYALDKRRILDLIKCCNGCDIIYTPFLARLGKSLKELYQIVNIANENKIKLIFCDKLNVSFSETDLNGRINLASLQWAVELQEQIKSENSKAGLSRKQDDISRTGNSRNKRGSNILRLGRPADGVDPETGSPYWDLSVANEASCIAKQEAAIRWREQSAAYNMVREWNAMGKNRNEMLAELQKLYEHAPEKFGTPKGRCVTRSVLDRWCREIENGYSPMNHNIN